MKQNEQGFTLVEMMVVVGIVGVVAVIAMRFMNQADESRVVTAARGAAQQINGQLQDLIERDLRFRFSDTSFSITPDHLSLTITRRQALDLNQLNQSDQTYQITFTTSCAPVPAPLTSYPSLATQLTTDRFKDTANCLKTVKCGTGQLPKVTLTINGSGRIPPYPSNVFPTVSGINRSFRSHALGTAACFNAAADQVRVTIDSVFASSKDTYAPLSQDKSVSIKAADFQLLPQEFKN